MHNTKDDTLLTARAVAERLNTTEANVRMMRRRGQLPPAVKIGRRVRWRANDVDAWLANLPAERDNKPSED